MVSLLKAKDLVVGYGQQAVAGPLDLEIRSGELVLLSGPNGSGKTTLLKTIAGLQRPLDGSLEAMDAYLVPSRIPKVKGFTVEDFMSLTVKGNIDSTLASLGITGLKERDLATLSDGQFQKVCIAPALAAGKSLILLDEPTAFLDHDSRLVLMRLLAQLTSGFTSAEQIKYKPDADAPGSENGISVIISSHDIELCSKFCTRTVSLG